MLCKQCEKETHIICGFDLNCPCCKKTLKEMKEEDERSYSLLIK
jgi:hypothetical protein